MKVAIQDSTNNKVGEVNLPTQFNEEVRPDLIKRAVLAVQSHGRQPYAPTATAGKRSSAKLSRRNPGSLGAWRAQGHIMWRVAHAGKMGYHLRTEYNKQLLKIGTKPEEINVKGGYLQYGNVKSTYVLLKGSVAGPQKRFIRFNEAMRAKKNPIEAPLIAYTSLDSKQGN